MPLTSEQDLGEFPTEAFSDVLVANELYARTYVEPKMGGTAARHLAVVTCMDSRIEPLALLGMKAGDVKILRNAGARVTDDVLRTLVLAGYLLGVERVLVLPHTKCKMASVTEGQVHREIKGKFGVETRSMEFRTVQDQERALADDVVRIRTNPLLPPGLVVAGAILDIETGRINPVDV